MKILKSSLIVVAALGIAALAIFTSCGKEKTKNIEVKTIDLSTLTELTDNTGFAPLYEGVDYIRLETTDDCLIGKINKVIETPKSIYVLSNIGRGGENDLFEFGKDGRFIRRIGHKGGGPGEYTRLASFTYNNDTLYLLDDYNSHILCYNSAGDYLSTLQTELAPSMPEEIIPLNNGGELLLRSQVNAYAPAVYSLISPNDSVSRPLISHPFERNDGMLPEVAAIGPISNIDDHTLLLLLPMSKKVYAFDTETYQLQPYIDINPGNDYPEPNDNENLEAYKNRLGAEMENTVRPISAFKHGKWIVLNAMLGSVVWNIETHEGFHTNNPRPDGNGDAWPFITTKIVSSNDDGGFISYITAGHLLMIKRNFNPEAQFMPSEELFEGLTEESNPILIRYKFKQ